MPQFKLWSDGADKERHIFLPAGTQIDTSDADNWVFPNGTRLYKTFSLNGRRIETRLLDRNSALASGWNVSTFRWDTPSSVVSADASGETDARDESGQVTTHDIPSTSACVQCHGSPVRILGFGAIQLNHASAEVSLQTLMDDGWLTDPISLSDATVPGTPRQRAALGHLHANCGGCHADGSFRRLRMNLRVRTNHVCDSPTYQTAAGATWNENGECVLEDVTSYWAWPLQASWGALLPMINTRAIPNTATELEYYKSSLYLRAVITRRLRDNVLTLMPPIANDVDDILGATTLEDWLWTDLRAGEGFAPVEAPAP